MEIIRFTEENKYEYLEYHSYQMLPSWYWNNKNKKQQSIFQYCGKDVYFINDKHVIIEQLHRNYARVKIISIDLSLYDQWLVKYQGYFGFGKTLKEANTNAKLNASREIPLEIRIEHFINTHPLFEEFTGQELFDWHDYLTGSCKAGKYKFCRDNNVDFNKKYTVLYFLNLVKDSYKPEIIEQVIKQYEKL